MGTGTGKGELRDSAKKLIDAAIAYLRGNPNSVIDKVYFLAYTDEQLEVCRGILDKKKVVQFVETPGPEPGTE